ncbi:MAG: vitamin B12-dependent ribonucleotide reductase [Deltaproteobacteria bacterium]|nr:vitamin B12-dependent ribonucleotide reductase [Deltaproteobacteria bacterium]
MSSEPDPLSSVRWSRRNCELRNAAGELVFRQLGVEAPDSWSDVAVTIAAYRYFSGSQDGASRESSVRHLITRVVETISRWSFEDGYHTPAESRIFRNELARLLVTQRAAFNSPVWFNVGLDPAPQSSACFIVAADDSLDALLELQRTEAKIFKHGSGAGSNLSRIRSSREELSAGGLASGPVSFMRAYDTWAAVIQSGGAMRRAAKMQILDATHPDILEFVTAKLSQQDRREARLRFPSLPWMDSSPAESSPFRNSNLSVRVDDSFMRAAVEDAPFSTRLVTQGKVSDTFGARSLLELIAFCAHAVGDLGLHFKDTVNRWHTCPTSGEIGGSNPCGEFLFVDNCACNLASLNLMRFLSAGRHFQVDEFLRAVSLLIAAQEILIDRSSYPSNDIAATTRRLRPLGLGFSNLGALLMTLGIPYDSKSARAYAASLASLMSAQAYLTSARMAAQRGPFEGYQENSTSMLKVISMHRDNAREIDSRKVPRAMYTTQLKLWEDAMSEGRLHGFRNAQVSAIAPTGTISLFMDCDTTGIEPEYALVKTKLLASGAAFQIKNRAYKDALKNLGYSQESINAISAHVESHASIERAPGLKEEHLPIFDCVVSSGRASRAISPEAQISMVAAVQPLISGGISKTIVYPHDSEWREFYSCYMSSWEKGLKSIALYRYGSKEAQPLSAAQ